MYSALFSSQKPILLNNIGDVLPTALLILDDYYPDNVVIGLECIYYIIQHSYMVIINYQSFSLNIYVYVCMCVYLIKCFRKKDL